VRQPGFVPEAGDVVWLEFDPKAGHEQAGRRPAVVLSPASYNGKTGLMICCPLTTRIKGYPFEVALSSQPGSVVLSDQVKNLDWRARRASRKGKVTDTELRQVRGKLRALIG
jgi:mRNA interferase MazF